MIFTRHLLIGTLLLLCSCGKMPNDGSSEIVGSAPITVAGITYRWPYDGSSEVGDPKKWSGNAFMPDRVWNAVVGVIPSMRRRSYAGYFVINLSPARRHIWHIKPDGSNVPWLNPSDRFVKLEENDTFVVGEERGPGIVNPPSIIVFKHEPSAYVLCSKGSVGEGACLLMLNDRGVQHTLTIPRVEWAEIPEILVLYRKLLGIPAK